MDGTGPYPEEDAPEAILARLAELDLLRFISPDIVFNKDKEKLFAQMRRPWHEFLYQGEQSTRVQFYILAIVTTWKLSDIMSSRRAWR